MILAKAVLALAVKENKKETILTIIQAAQKQTPVMQAILAKREDKRKQSITV